MPETHPPRIRELLAGHSTITPATAADGRSAAGSASTPAMPDLNLYFVSDLKQRHCCEMDHHACVTGGNQSRRVHVE